jgi:hypothetical protein
MGTFEDCQSSAGVFENEVARDRGHRMVLTDFLVRSVRLAPR